ncbi:MAG: M55 family metallopeptidase [Anaerolineaceae bacterium]
MKVLIACDMEGISGVVNWNQVTPSHAEYPRFRQIMTGDVNAAIEGAAGSGADEILVTDGHWFGTNIMIELLDPRAQLNCGSPSHFSMVQGVDDGVDAAIFIGYHARIGTQNAILDHTWSSERVRNLWLNDRLCGEFGLNALMCGAFDVPVLMVSGDQSVCAEAREWSPEILTAQVKTAAGRTAAACLPLEQTRALISSTATTAMFRFKDGIAAKPLKIDLPVTVTVEFSTTVMADQSCLMPGSKRLDGRRVSVQAASMPEAYLAFRSLVNLVSI